MLEWIQPGVIIGVSLGFVTVALLVFKLWPDIRLNARGRCADGLVVACVSLNTDIPGQPARCARVRFMDHEGEYHVFVSQERTPPAYRTSETHETGDTVRVSYDVANPWIARIVRSSP